MSTGREDSDIALGVRSEPVERREPLALWMRRLDYENADMTRLDAWIVESSP